MSRTFALNLKLSSDQQFHKDEFNSLVPDLAKYVQTLVNPGYLSFDEIVAEATQEVEYELGAGKWRKQTQAVVRNIYDSFVADQKNWPERTDCDLLDEAFESIAEYKVLARQNYWCCKECSAQAIDDEMHEKIVKFGEKVNGFIYYNEQDTAAAVLDYELKLSFAAADYDVEHTIVLAALMLSEFQAHGLKATWSGIVNEPIILHIDYKRRRRSEIRFPFANLAKLGQRNREPERAVHYVSEREIDPMLLSKSEPSSEDDKGVVGEWAALLKKHLRSDAPASIKLEGAKIALMRECFEMKRKFLERRRRPVTTEELASLLNVHSLVVSAIDELLQFHMSELG